MSTSSRHTAIMDILNKTGRVTVSELSNTLSVTVETVRRNLAELEREGALRRIRGGAELISNLETYQQSVKEIRTTNMNNKTNERSKFSVAISKMLKPGMTVMIGASKLTMNILDNVPATCDLSIITNSLDLIQKYKHCANLSFICTGGDLDVKLNAFYGVDAASTVRHYNADIAFLACDSIAMDFGLMHQEMMASEITLSMIDQAEERVLLVNEEQLDHNSKINTAHFSDISTIIIDGKFDKEWTEYLDDEGVKVQSCSSAKNNKAQQDVSENNQADTEQDLSQNAAKTESDNEANADTEANAENKLEANADNEGESENKATSEATESIAYENNSELEQNHTPVF